MSAVNPYPLVDRIPEDQPFIVRWHRRKLITRTILIAVFFLPFVVGGAIGSFVAFDRSLPIALFVLMTPLTAALLIPNIRAMSDGPILAVGPAGLWIKIRSNGRQAIWLPWESIAMITRFSRRAGAREADKLLVVRPADPRALQGLGSGNAVLGFLTDFNSGNWFGGGPDGFNVTIKLADRPEEEILQAVAYYAANRVPLG